jgi:hypothetical protein
MTDSKDGPGTRPVPDIDELAKTNPKVNAAEIHEAGELLKHLREKGLTRPTYGLASPHTRRTIQRSPRKDPPASGRPRPVR